MKIKKTLGEAMRELRTEVGLSVGQLAEKSGYSRQMIWRIESNKMNVKIGKIIGLAELLGAKVTVELIHDA